MDDDDEAGSVPAIESSIEGLDKVILDDLGSNTPCMVCLEELSVGSEVARMPCSHVYHDGCIVKWLRESHMCPLCRFEMPKAN